MKTRALVHGACWLLLLLGLAAGEGRSAEEPTGLERESPGASSGTPAASDAPIDEPNADAPIVRGIHWTGVEAFDEDELEARIVTTAQPRISLRFWKPKRRLDEFDVQEDLDRIVEAYREIGYFRAEADVRIADIGPGRVAVWFTVEEGPRVHLQAWTLEIVGVLGDDDAITESERTRLQRHVDFESGEALGSNLYRERRNALLAECAEIGFPSARISGGANVEPEAGIARVEWRLELGPRTYFGSIRITGLERIDEKIVLRQLRFGTGDRFVLSKIEESERRLVDTGLFRSVAIGRSSSTDAAAKSAKGAVSDRLAIVVRVEEAPPRSFRASVGYGTEDGPRAELSLSWRNFTGESRLLRLRTFASFLDAGFEGSLGQPYVLGDSSRADLTVSALRQSRPGYEAFVTGASGIVTYYPDREGPWSLAIGPGYELANISDFEIDIGEPLRGPRQSVIVNWFTVARYQRVDDPVDPRQGFRVELANEVGGFPIGSDLDYQRWELDARIYQSTGPLVWAARAAATTLDPISGGLADVPLTRRLYSGGTNSVRGFGFQKLGPTDSGNDPTGGLSRMELGVEVRVPVWRQFGLVGFVDAGDVRVRPWSWRPKDLRAAAGPGLRIGTPVGPLRFDVGFLLNAPPDVDPWRFHLSVGQAF